MAGIQLVRGREDDVEDIKPSRIMRSERYVCLVLAGQLAYFKIGFIEFALGSRAPELLVEAVLHPESGAHKRFDVGEVDDERIRINGAAVLHNRGDDPLAEVGAFDHIVLPQTEPVGAHLVECIVAGSVVRKLGSSFARLVNQPSGRIHDDRRLISDLAVHVDLEVPATDHNCAVRHRRLVVRGRRSEVYLVRAGELERRCFALPLTRFFTELARKRVDVALHKPRHVGEEVKKSGVTALPV